MKDETAARSCYEQARASLKETVGARHFALRQIEERLGAVVKD